MNRIIKMFSIVLILLLVGCKNKSIICTIDLENKEQDYKLDATYKIDYKGNYVTKIEKEEVYISTNKDTINYFDEYKDLEYKKLNSLYQGYTYKIDTYKEKVIATSTIDFNLVDIKQMIIDGYLNRDYVVSNKLTVSGAKYYYISKGATCNG